MDQTFDKITVLNSEHVIDELDHSFVRLIFHTIVTAPQCFSGKKHQECFASCLEPCNEKIEEASPPAPELTCNCSRIPCWAIHVVYRLALHHDCSLDVRFSIFLFERIMPLPKWCICTRLAPRWKLS